MEQVTEALNGGDLFDLLYDKYNGKLPEAHCAANARCLLSALAHIHARGWVHRDIKVCPPTHVGPF